MLIKVIKRFNEQSTICDMMCGVGPLALRAAKSKGCNVFANDLNPSCFEFLKKNVRENHLS